VLAEHAAQANTNQEDAQAQQTLFALIAQYADPANTAKAVARDLKTLYVQIALRVLQDNMHQERAPDQTTLPAHDALRAVPQDNAYRGPVPNPQMLFAANARPAALESSW